MQIVIEVADAKADFVLELLSNLPFVAIQKEEATTEQHKTASLMPKTTHLLGLFPQLADAEASVREQAILTKHA